MIEIYLFNENLPLLGVFKIYFEKQLSLMFCTTLTRTVACSVLFTDNNIGFFLILQFDFVASPI